MHRFASSRLVLVTGCLLLAGCPTVERKSGQVELFRTTPYEQILVRPGGPLTDMDNFLGTSHRTSRQADFGDRIRLEGDVFALVVNRVYIDDLPATLTGSTDVVLFTEVWENAAAGTSAEPITSVVFVANNQMLPGVVNFQNNLAFGPTSFKGHPLKIRFTLMVLQKRKGAEAGGVADVIKKYSAAVPGYGQFLSPAAGVMRDILRAQPDIIAFDFETTFFSDGPEKLSATITGDKPAVRAGAAGLNPDEMAEFRKQLMKPMELSASFASESEEALVKKDVKGEYSDLQRILSGLMLPIGLSSDPHHPAGRKKVDDRDRLFLERLLIDLKWSPDYRKLDRAQREEAIATLYRLLDDGESAESKNFGWFQFGHYALIETLARDHADEAATSTVGRAGTASNSRKPVKKADRYLDEDAPEDAATHHDKRRVYFIDSGYVVKSTLIDRDASGTTRTADLHQLILDALTGGRVRSHMPEAREVKSTYVVFSVVPRQLLEDNETLKAASTAAGSLLTNLQQSADNLRALNESIDQGAKDLKYAVLRARANTLADKIANEPGQTPEGFRGRFDAEFAHLRQGFGALDHDIPQTEIDSIARQATDRQIAIFRSVGQVESAGDADAQSLAKNNDAARLLTELETGQREVAKVIAGAASPTTAARQAAAAIAARQEQVDQLAARLDAALKLPAGDSSRQQTLRQIAADLATSARDLTTQFAAFQNNLDALKTAGKQALVAAENLKSQLAAAQTLVTQANQLATAGRTSAGNAFAGASADQI